MLGPFRLQDGSKTAPRRCQGAPKTAEDVPRRPQDGPRGPQETPKTVQDAAKTYLKNLVEITDSIRLLVENSPKRDTVDNFLIGV